MEEFFDKIEKERKEILEKVEKWFDDFSKTSYFKALNDEEKDSSYFIITNFTQFMYNYHYLAPEQWEPESVEDCCLYTMPDKIIAEDSLFEAISPVLSAFFSFLDEKKLLKNASGLSMVVKKIDKQIVERAKNPDEWDTTKLMLMTAKEMGYDITNQVELQKFIILYNLFQANKLVSSKKVKLKKRKLKKEKRTKKKVEPLDLL